MQLTDLGVNEILQSVLLKLKLNNDYSIFKKEEPFI